MLTSQEEDLMVKFISKIEPYSMSAKTHEAVAQKFCLTAIETVILREREGKIEVLLVRRPQYDNYYANMWHTPGTILRSTDHSYAEAWGRTQLDELDVKFAITPKFVASIVLPTLRGTEHSMIFYTHISEEPKVGQYFPVDALPEDLVTQHFPVIEAAAKAYQKDLEQQR